MWAEKRGRCRWRTKILLNRASVLIDAGCCRLPGSQTVCPKWAAAMDAARQGHIPQLKVLTLDVIMAPGDGADRWACTFKHITSSCMHVSPRLTGS